MKIEHIAIWSNDIDRLRDFYVQYFGASSNNKYINKKKGFSSYFLSFEDGSRLELMSVTNLVAFPGESNINYVGMAHFAISVGSSAKVDGLTALLKQNGFKVVDGPRTTGDGYYESIILDPDKNRIEITI
jgi:lactoylglutathione lyase